eukprot:496778-Rhodomonas_salina.1
MQCRLTLGLKFRSRRLCQRKLLRNDLALTEGCTDLPCGVRQKLNLALAQVLLRKWKGTGVLSSLPSTLHPSLPLSYASSRPHLILT